MANENAFNPSPQARAILEKHSSLLKQATALKNAKRYDEAVGCLRAAYELANRHQIGKTAASLTRLPNYLALAGRVKEAWLEYNKVADMTYCYWYRSDQQTVAVIQADAYSRLAQMLRKNGYKAQASVFALVGYIVGRSAAKLNHDWCRKEGIKDIGRWNTHEGLEDALQDNTSHLPTEQQQLLRRMIVEELKGIPRIAPKVLITKLYQALDCTDPAFGDQEGGTSA